MISLRPRLELGAVAAFMLLATGCATHVDQEDIRVKPVATSPAPAAGLRIATFNASLYDNGGNLSERLANGDAAASAAAEVIRHVRPDILLINEFDYDPDGRSAQLFQRRYLQADHGSSPPIHYPYYFAPPVNTGVPSGLDLNQDGRSDGPNDAWGFGRHPGQYGFLILSRFPIDSSAIRTFQHLPWSSMPDARRPVLPDDGRFFHSEEVWLKLRLSSKSHADVPIETPIGRIHLLASHPTPPIFDGPEGLNKRRNFDEIRFWAEYIRASTEQDAQPSWIIDDRGNAGGLPPHRGFVVLGDLNADPFDGNGLPGTIQQLLEHPAIRATPAPRSVAAAQLKRFGSTGTHRTDAATDTAQFGEVAGNMRVDYVLPSRTLNLRSNGVFWPDEGETGHDWIRHSDHRMVWIDVAAGGATASAED